MGIEEKTMNEKKHGGWSALSDQEQAEVQSFAGEYMDFLNRAKTEREAVNAVREMAEKAGFRNLDTVSALAPGDKVYSVNRGKSMFLAVMGTEPLTEGARIVGAHIDSPRLDLKQIPLYEDGELALFKTHYYGGIKKYQWTAIPLALHGVIVKDTGETVTVNIGEGEDDPIFTITDLLPHLGAQQGKKTLASGIAGEDLNVLVGSLPASADKKETGREDGEDCKEDAGRCPGEGRKGGVKDGVMKLLKKKYGICEEDFASAEIEVVPAFKARSLGFDESMVAGYGQDDKVCAYPGVRALLELAQPEKTAICILSDKEEVGSMGNTGMESQVFELFLMDLLEKSGIVNPYALQRLLVRSACLSADVTAAFDPNYPAVMEKKNSAYIGAGICINKYTGARGKSGASDANAEFLGFVRGVFNRNSVCCQSAEMGKVDEGGGGTIAYILANKGMEVLDCGVPVLSMHAPYEVAGKFDIYMAYRAYGAFWKESAHK